MGEAGCLGEPVNEGEKDGAAHDISLVDACQGAGFRVSSAGFKVRFWVRCA